MTDVVAIPLAGWDQQPSLAEQQQAILALESGDVVFLPRLSFRILSTESPLLSPEVRGRAKNVSLLPSGAVRGTDADDAEVALLKGMMTRFADASAALMRRLFPLYAGRLQRARTSYRPVDVVGRQTSWRQDDTRLHVDSFPTSPMQGRRILRFFSNIDPGMRPRRWRMGEPFDDVARRFVRTIKAPAAGSSFLLSALRLTKSRRTAYDHYMLRLHDRMKSDTDYQAQVTQRLYDFPAESSWIVFTDQVSHAAMSGQYALEQTFYLPVESMQHPGRSPLRVLEGLLGCKLA
jgi:hypothetical protein